MVAVNEAGTDHPMSKLQSPKLNTPIVAGRVYHDSTMRRLDTTLENVTGGLWDIPVNNHMLFSH